MADCPDAEAVLINSNDLDGAQLLEALVSGVYDVSAIFCWNDSAAVQMVETLMGPDSPLADDFSLMGFDDLPIAGMATPRLSTVRVDREAIGRGVVRLMSNQLDGERAVQQLEIGLTLVEGDTVRLRGQA